MKKRFSSEVCTVESGCTIENRPPYHKTKKTGSGRIMYQLPMNAIYTASDLGISYNEVSDMARS